MNNATMAVATTNAAGDRLVALRFARLERELSTHDAARFYWRLDELVRLYGPAARSSTPIVMDVDGEPLHLTLRKARRLTEQLRQAIDQAAG